MPNAVPVAVNVARAMNPCEGTRTETAKLHAENANVILRVWA